MSDKIKAFLQEYRDLVHRHGLGIGGVANHDGSADGLVVTVRDPDAHVAEIADERPSDIAKGKAGKK